MLNAISGHSYISWAHINMLGEMIFRMKSYKIPLESGPPKWGHKRGLKTGGMKRRLNKVSQWFIENKSGALRTFVGFNPQGDSAILYGHRQNETLERPTLAPGRGLSDD